MKFPPDLLYVFIKTTSHPTLIDLPMDGTVVKAPVQPTKMGELILLDRYTGRSLGTPKDVAVPASNVPGKKVEETIEEGISGYTVYMSSCASCHGTNKEGQTDIYPALTNLEERLSDPEIQSVIRKGKGLMPAFAQLDEAEMEALVSFLKGSPDHDG